MRKSEENNTVTLEELLKIKRSERPHGEFWEAFDDNFEKRRLHALVERPSFFGRALIPVSRALVFSLPVLLLAGLAAFWMISEEVPATMPVVENTVKPLDAPELPEKKEVHMERRGTSRLSSAEMTGLASSQFVVDAIEDSSGHPMNFRKVLYTPALHLSIPSGSFYVEDSFSDRNYGVTTAELKLGRNF